MATGWTAFFARMGSSIPPLLREVVRSTGPASNAAADRRPVKLDLGALAGAGDARRVELMADYLRQGAAAALGIGDPNQIALRRPLRELGLDSLMAVELRNAVAAAVGRELPGTLLFDYPTVESLARFLVSDLFPAATEATTTAAPNATAANSAISHSPFPTPHSSESPAAAPAPESTAAIADELAAALAAGRRRSDRSKHPSSSRPV
jgi:acyl carrier protein